MRTAAKSPDFSIIEETPDYIVVDKPPLLLVHPTKPNSQATLWAALRELLAFEIANGGQISIVNRLDRETSGIVLVAKNAAAARHFGLAMQQRKVRKEYLAIVHGWPSWDQTSVKLPLLRQGAVRPCAVYLKQAVHPRGAEAVSEFQVLQRFEKLTPAGHRFALIQASPLTGRTHQIRVHLAELGHPIVGDKLYGPDEKLYLRFIQTGWTPELERALLLPRHALHAARLRIDHGREWSSALPGDLARFL